MLEIVAACLVLTALPAYQNLLVCDGAAMPANPGSTRRSPSQRWQNMPCRRSRPCTDWSTRPRTT